MSTNIFCENTFTSQVFLDETPIGLLQAPQMNQQNGLQKHAN